jgi:hypothetical protein
MGDKCDCSDCDKKPASFFNRWMKPKSQLPCNHKLTDQECDHYLIQYPDVLQQCGGDRNNRKCARNHWKKNGCREGRTYKLPSSCDYTLTDEEAICYIENNSLDFKPIGNDLNKARKHWKEIGCIQNLNYSCKKESEIAQLNDKLTITDNLLKDLGEDYKKYVDTTEENVENILKLEVTSLPFVINNVKIQNTVLGKKLETINTEKLTENQGAFYLETQNESLTKFNNILFWVYFIVVFILTGVLFGLKLFDFYYKIYIVIFFLIFPFIIYYLEYGLWFVYQYAISLTYSTLFTI